MSSCQDCDLSPRGFFEVLPGFDLIHRGSLLFRKDLTLHRGTATSKKRGLAAPQIPTSTLHLPSPFECGLGGLPLRASNEGLLRPRVARAQENSSLPNSHFTPSTPLGEWPDCPLLRALREHILIVRPQRARRTIWLLPSAPGPAQTNVQPRSPTGSNSASAMRRKRRPWRT